MIQGSYGALGFRVGVRRRRSPRCGGARPVERVDARGRGGPATTSKTARLPRPRPASQLHQQPRPEVSGDGLVVAGDVARLGSATRAVRWTAATGMQESLLRCRSPLSRPRRRRTARRSLPRAASERKGRGDGHGRRGQEREPCGLGKEGKAFDAASYQLTRSTGGCHFSPSKRRETGWNPREFTSSDVSPWWSGSSRCWSSCPPQAPPPRALPGRCRRSTTATRRPSTPCSARAPAWGTEPRRSRSSSHSCWRRVAHPPGASHPGSSAWTRVARYRRTTAAARTTRSPRSPTSAAAASKPSTASWG
jgi:hypothetical protein